MKWPNPSKKFKHNQEEIGIIKYGIAWFMGVPVTLLIVIFLVARGC